MILFLLYRNLDFSQFRDSVFNSNTEWLLVLAGTILLEQLIRGWKWRQILLI